MVYGLRFTVLSLIIVSAMSSSTEAQQPPISDNKTRIAQIKQLRQEMDALRHQLGPLLSQLQEYVAQTKVLRDKTHSVQEKLKVDRDELQSLIQKHG